MMLCMKEHDLCLDRPSNSLVVWFSVGPRRDGSYAPELNGTLCFVVVPGL